MRKIIENYITLSIALVGFIGGGFWSFKSDWDWEPLILLVCSFLEIVGFILLKSLPEDNTIQNNIPTTNTKKVQNIKNKGTVNKQININENNGNIQM